MSEIVFILLNFQCQNIQTMEWGGGIRAQSECPNFGVWDNVQNFIVFYGFP